MNQELINKWNSRVKPGDLVYHLGDLMFKYDPQILDKLNGEIRLVPGNHDFLLGGHAYKTKNGLLKEELPLINYKVDKKLSIVLCHYPLREWEGYFRGWLHLYGHCLSGDTELLTKSGFIKYSELKIGQEALTLNLKTDTLQYNKIKHVYVRDVIGKIIKFKSKSGEMLLTEEHRVLYKSHYKNRLHFVKASEAQQWSRLIIPVNRNSKGIKYNIKPEFFQLLGLIISDGHFHKSELKNPGNGITIYQKSENSEFIEDCLKKNKSIYNKHVYKSGMTTFYITAPYVKEYIYPWLDSKNISSKLMNLRGKEFLGLLSGLIYGDGNVNSKVNKRDFCESMLKSYPHGIYCTYNTSNTSLKDNLQHLCTLNGFKSRSAFRKHGFGDGAWYIGIIDKQNIIFSHEKEYVEYTGKVWCVDVDNTTIVCRRNGFIFITGNCHNNLQSKERSMDVGVDANRFYPVSLEEVLERLT